MKQVSGQVAAAATHPQVAQVAAASQQQAYAYAAQAAQQVAQQHAAPVRWTLYIVKDYWPRNLFWFLNEVKSKEKKVVTYKWSEIK